MKRRGFILILLLFVFCVSVVSVSLVADSTAADDVRVDENIEEMLDEQESVAVIVVLKRGGVTAQETGIAAVEENAENVLAERGDGFEEAEERQKVRARVVERQVLEGMKVRDAERGRDADREAAEAERVRLTGVRLTDDAGIIGEDVVTGEDGSTEEDAVITGEDTGEQYDFALEREFSFFAGFSGNITKAGLAKLRENPNVEGIYVDEIRHIFLTDSVPQINANDVWNFSVGGYNITGVSETVCVIDTGINYSHAGLGGGLGIRVIDGYDFVNSDTDPQDDHGHGTHVAGIIGSNDSTYKGVAPGVKFVALKACNSGGSCSDSNVLSSISWCIDNSTLYNISVISISLGGGQYTGYCDNDVNSQYHTLISSAVGKNISVVVATGNTGSTYTNKTGGIATPACIENATRVTAVDKSDGMASYAFRHFNFTDFIAAPGSSIVSLSYTGGTTSSSGTSMATPHVSGAVALTRQYHRVAYGGGVPSVSYIMNKIRTVGVQISDLASGSTLIIPRVDVLALMQPFINYTSTSVANGSTVLANNVLINISSDVNLSVGLLEWHYNNGTVQNLSMSAFNGTSYYLTIGNLADGNDFYQVYGNDTVNTFGKTSIRNITIDATVPAVTVVNPANGSNFSSGTQAFNATVLERSIDSVLFSFDNVTGSGIAFNVSASNNSGNWNANVDLLRLQEGRHVMNVLANDTAGNYNRTSIVQFVVDRTAPLVVFVTPSADRNFSVSMSNQTFNVSIRDNLLSMGAVLFSFDNSSGAGFNISALNSSGYWSMSYNVSTLAEGNHIVTVLANDSVGNYNRSVNVSFAVDFTPPAVTLNSLNNGQNFTILSSNQTFNATIRDSVTGLYTLHDVLFSFDNATGVGFNISAFNSSGYWIVSYNVSTLGNGNHTVTVLANDSAGNSNFTQSFVFTVDLETPVVVLNSPTNRTNSSVATVMFNCNSIDNTSLSSVALYGNWSSGWHANVTNTTVDGKSNVTLFTLTLLDGTYVWNCLATDGSGNSGFGAGNYTITVDTIYPLLTSISSGSPTSSAATITWTTSEAANASVDYGTTLALGTRGSVLSKATSQSVSLSSLSASTTYYYNVTSCDYAGNCNRTDGGSFATAAAGSSSSSSSSSSGGGGGSSSGGGGGSSKKAEVSAVSSVPVASVTPTAAVAASVPAESAGGGAVTDVAGAGVSDSSGGGVQTTQSVGGLGEGQVDSVGEVGAGKGISSQEVSGWRSALAGFAFYEKGREILLNKKVLIGMGVFLVMLIVLSVWVYFGRRGGIGKSGMSKSGSVNITSVKKQDYGFGK